MRVIFTALLALSICTLVFFADRQVLAEGEWIEVKLSHRTKSANIGYTTLGEEDRIWASVRGQFIDYGGLNKGGRITTLMDNDTHDLEVKVKGATAKKGKTMTIKSGKGSVSTDFRYKDGTNRKYKINFRYNEEYEMWEYRSGTLIEGVIGETKIVIIDDSNDGRFNTYEEDALAIGDTRYAGSLSRVIMLDGKLYEIDVVESGVSLKYRLYTGGTGKVDVFANYSRPLRPECITFLCAGARDCYIDLAKVEGEVDLPLGNVFIKGGWLAKGNWKCFIDGGRFSFSVIEKETSKPTWGQPVKYTNVSPEFSEETVLLSHTGIDVYGAGNERYARFSPEEVLPRFEVREKGGRSIKKGGFKKTKNKETGEYEVLEIKIKYKGNAEIEAAFTDSNYGTILGDAVPDWVQVFKY